MKYEKLEPKFVKGVPRDLEPGVLYVSMEYGTVVHACCCGCELEVVTPLSPTDWQLTFNGEAVSLWPSVGNWNLPCRSHYVIRQNRVLGAGPWSDARVKAAQKREQEVRDRFYRGELESKASAPPPAHPSQASVTPAPAPRRGWFSWWKR